MKKTCLDVEEKQGILSAVKSGLHVFMIFLIFTLEYFIQEPDMWVFSVPGNAKYDL